MQPNPVLKKLGFSPGDRVVIIHTDDIGLCQATVDAFADLFDFGLISSGAMMVPCPWFFEAAAFARTHPAADLGVHLTLTCEYERYRWGPLSTRNPGCTLPPSSQRNRINRSRCANLLMPWQRGQPCGSHPSPPESIPNR